MNNQISAEKSKHNKKLKSNEINKWVEQTTPTQNRFQDLEQIEVDESNYPSLLETIGEIRRKKTTTAEQRKQKSRSGDDEATIEKTVVNVKVPPIITEKGLDTAKLAKLLRDEKQVDFSIRILPNNKKIIKCLNMDSHKLIINKLKEHKVEGHTYTAKNEKPVVLLGKGIHYSYDDDEVINEIKQNHGINCKVKQFTTSKATIENRRLNAKVISFENGTSMGDILKIKYIFNHQVTWEHLKKNEIIQCLNCKRFGHIARNCLNKFRCIKCNIVHERGECKRKQCTECNGRHGDEGCNIVDKENENYKEDPVYCVNCQKFGHPANYKGCAVYMSVMDNKNKLKEAKRLDDRNKMEARQFAQNSVRNMITKDVSFASVVKPSVVTTVVGNEQKGNLMTFLQKESENLLGLSLTQTMQRVNNFMVSYKTIIEREEKQVALITFLMQWPK